MLLFVQGPYVHVWREGISIQDTHIMSAQQIFVFGGYSSGMRGFKQVAEPYSTVGEMDGTSVEQMAVFHRYFQAAVLTLHVCITKVTVNFPPCLVCWYAVPCRLVV